jgi:glycosyltransferase involved in cell wall biosynthesis
VAPACNEAGNIAPLVAEIAAALEGRAFEIICVDDGSEDATADKLRGLMAQHPWQRQSSRRCRRAFGVFIYLRNLSLVLQERKVASSALTSK